MRNRYPDFFLDFPYIHNRQVRTQYRTLTNIDRYQTDIDEYCQFLQERSLFRKACRNSFDEFGLWATRCNDLPPICIRMHSYASVCTHMPPYALFTLPNANIQHTLSPKKSKSQTNKDWFELGNYIALAIPFLG